jgi:type IV pilus assembly protein PilC
MSNFIVNYGLWFGLFLIIFTVAFIFAYRKEPFKFFMHHVYLKVPIIGGIITKISLARFATTLHSLLNSGISVVEALKITADVLPNRPYKNALMVCSEKIKQGTELSVLLNDFPDLFPPLVVSMVDVGERTGSIETTLKELADFFNDGADKTLKNLTTVLEPIIILFLGVVVASMALAVVMPMFTLQQSF